jgi:hypothetical protein
VPLLAILAVGVAPLATYLMAAAVFAALAAAVGQLARRPPRRQGDERLASRGRIPVASWRGSAALVVVAAAGILLAPVVVALRQVYALPGVGARGAALVMVLLLLVAAAVLAVLFADPGEDR